MKKQKWYFCLVVCMILFLFSFGGLTCHAQEQYNTVQQLTEEDIQEINNGQAILVYGNNGYLSFLKGRFYDKPVDDYNKGIEALYGIANLLGLQKGSDFFCVYGESENGFVTFTYKQRYGSQTIKNATIKIVLDAEGYPVGVSSSISPYVGLSVGDDYRITAEEAEQMVRDLYPDETIRIYSENTAKTAVTAFCVTKHAWAVYSDNPDRTDDHVFLEHLIDYKGNYITAQPVFSMTNPEGDSVIQEMALSNFRGLEPAVYKGTVTCCDGTVREIEVPVAYSPVTGKYYLADLERHIMMADYWDFYMNDQLSVWYSTDNRNWPEEYLITYESYQKVFDFYAARNMYSVDGFGTPLLILTDFCDKNRRQIKNAAYAGIMDGWACFYASTEGNYGECLDVIGHEFTHAVTEYSVGGSVYENESGAINEAISDIQGNICENILGVQDEEWLAGQQSGEPTRSLSNPNEFMLPSQVYGDYYYPLSSAPAANNDYGGIHTNSVIIGHIGWTLYNRGMDLETEYRYWHTITNLLTPSSGFLDVRAAMFLAADMNLFGDSWTEPICQVWDQAYAEQPEKTSKGSIMDLLGNSE